MKRIRTYSDFLVYESLSEEMIEVSCAALASIVVDGKYLLFKEKEKYQPIGGGLKFLDSAVQFLESIGYQTNYSKPEQKNDLRIKIPKSKWLEFKQWFISGKDREMSIEREIEEEFIGKLSQDVINLMQTDDFEIKEVISSKSRIFQIHKVEFDDMVKQALVDLVKNDDAFILVTPEEISAQKSFNDEVISDHSSYIILSSNNL